MAGSGGAWKVAFADFMTAMMALFLVLWISAQDKKILIATSQYFQNPFNSPMDNTSGIMPYNNDKVTQSKGDDEGTGKNQSKQVEVSFLNSVAAEFYRLLHLEEDMADKPIDVQVTSDGLRITLFDRARRPLFVGDTAELSEWGKFVIQSLAWMIDRHHFGVTIDGHTRSGYTSKREDYGPWELTTDRANATRRSLVLYAVDAGQIERVTGYAATRPMPKEPPDSEANQRITLSLTLTARPKPSAVTQPSTVSASSETKQPAHASSR